MWNQHTPVPYMTPLPFPLLPLMSLCPPTSTDVNTKPAKKHKPQKVFQCAGYGDCSMTFTRGEHLARHIRKHTGERPYQCQCGRMFSRLDNLRQHAQTVHANDSAPQIRAKPRPHPLTLPQTAHHHHQNHYASPPISPSSSSLPGRQSVYWAPTAAPSPPLTAEPRPRIDDPARRSSLAHIFDQDDEDKVNRRRTWHCNDSTERRLPSIASLFGTDTPPLQSLHHHFRTAPTATGPPIPRRYSLPVRPIPRPARPSISSNTSSSPLATPEEQERELLPPVTRKRGSVSIAELCQPTATRLRIADDVEDAPQSKMDVLVQASLLQHSRQP